MRIFNVLDIKLSDKDNSFAIYLHLDDDEDSGSPYISRVVWTKGNDDGIVDFSRFAVSEEEINMCEIENLDEFFQPLKEKREAYVRKRVKALKKEEVEKNFAYSIKYIGEKGKSKTAYTCERRNEFGLKWSGETACSYCKHCAMTIVTKEVEKTKCAIYCCYPYMYREPDTDAHPGYECFESERFNL